jgi:glutamyl-Q tRNA(Asp) synthetase
MSTEGRYTGRFAPSPTGLLHAGSLVAALASWLDARAHGGRWLVRIEDVDTPRCVPGAAEGILGQLAACGLHADGPVRFQSTRFDAYARALQRLVDAGHAFPCNCSRADIERALLAAGRTPARHAERPYPGTCRNGLGGTVGSFEPKAMNAPGSAGKHANLDRDSRCAWRLRCVAGPVAWEDRRLGPQCQDVSQFVGDFVLKRADGLWAYQLAVVVDDADQGVTDVVRGEDLADNTARQRLLQAALGLPHPSYLHTPLVLAADGQKLSKQNGARALSVENEATALAALRDAADSLGLPPWGASSLGDGLAFAVAAWQARFCAVA